MASNTGRRRRRSGSGDRPDMSVRTSGEADLNVVFCGSDEALKASVSKCFMGEKTRSSSDQTEFRSVCLMEKKIHGCLITLLELPALTRLSEEEVMRQTLSCVSLCHPGVHAFIIIIPDAPRSNKEKAELEKIQRLFDSRDHFMLLFTTELSVKRLVTDFIKSSPESQRLISVYGGQYRVMELNEPENSRQIPELLEYIKNMKTEPYSLQMYVKAQENRARKETEEKYEEKLKRKENKIKELLYVVGAECEDDLERLRIVLIGKTGNGKSATGNTILGRNEFVSQASMDSVTTVCQKAVSEVDGQSVAVVDTPGFFDTTLTNDQVVEEIMKCVSLSSPGPHVFLIVLSVGRFNQVETDTMDLIKKIFGHKAAQFSIVLFTRGDDLQGKSVEDYVRRNKSAGLKNLIRDCGNRFLAFNNIEKQDKTQVIQLLKMIEEVKNTNEGRYFTNRMFEEAIKKRTEEIMKRRERDIQAQNEKLRVKYEIDMENMRKRLEEEKRKIENDCREKMEKLRKEFEEKEKIDHK